MSVDPGTLIALGPRVGRAGRPLCRHACVVATIAATLLAAAPASAGDGLLGTYYDQGGVRGAYFTGTATAPIFIAPKNA